MPSRKCKDPAEAAQLCQLLRDQGLTPKVTRLSVEVRCHLKSDKERWQRALSKLVAQQELRKLADRYMEQGNLLQ